MCAGLFYLPFYAIITNAKTDSHFCMDIDLKHLIQLVKKSKLLTDAERKSWLRKMEKMNEEQLKKLQGVLEHAETINWDEAIVEYEEAVERAEQVCARAESKLREGSV